MARCPFCEYEGSSSSVEAHISGCVDEDHKGKLGSNYRGIIEASVGSLGGDPEADEGELFDLPPSLALVAATAVLAVIVLAGSSELPEPVDEEEADDVGEWS